YPQPLSAPNPLAVIPAQAGIHSSEPEPVEKWVPVSAGTTMIILRSRKDGSDQVLITTLCNGSPRTKRSRLAARSPQRRSAVPSVNPEQCGVISTFDSSWNGNRDGRRSGCSGLQCCHHTSSAAPPS